MTERLPYFSSRVATRSICIPMAHRLQSWPQAKIQFAVNSRVDLVDGVVGIGVGRAFGLRVNMWTRVLYQISGRDPRR